MNNHFGVTREAICQWFTRDCVTRENYWQIASLVTQKSSFTVTHALFFISYEVGTVPLQPHTSGVYANSGLYLLHSCMYLLSSCANSKFPNWYMYDAPSGKITTGLEEIIGSNYAALFSIIARYTFVIKSALCWMAVPVCLVKINILTLFVTYRVIQKIMILDMGNTYWIGSHISPFPWIFFSVGLLSENLVIPCIYH